MCSDPEKPAYWGIGSKKRGWRSRGVHEPECPAPGRTIMKARLLLISIALLLSPVFSHAQGLGSIVGTLTDSTGAAVASAKVTATQTATGLSREAISNSDGYFVLSSLSPTDYSL